MVSLENNGLLLSSSKVANFETILEDIDKAIAGDTEKPNTIIVDAIKNSLEIPSIQIHNLNKSRVLEAVGFKAHCKSLLNFNTVIMEETLGSFALG